MQKTVIVTIAMTITAKKIFRSIEQRLAPSSTAPKASSSSISSLSKLNNSGLVLNLNISHRIYIKLVTKAAIIDSLKRVR
jgi:hypothetical protein